MRVFKLRQKLHKRALLLLEHGTGWLVTNNGTVKTLVEKTFDTLEQVVEGLPNRLMEHEADEWDEEFQRFVEAEHGRNNLPCGDTPNTGLPVDRIIET